MKRTMTRRRLWMVGSQAALGMAGLAAIRPAAAASLSQPVEKPILHITGRIAVTNSPDVAEFDRPMLEAMGMSGFETTTPWHKGPVRFDGVRMDRVLDEVGAAGNFLVVYALNDYSVEIPIEDFTRFNVLLAMKRDNQYMTVRDKGPLFIVYPYDSLPELQHDKYYSRSVWQVARFVVK